MDPGALAEKVLTATDVAFLATCEDDAPRLRPVNIAHREGLTLWIASYTAWGKVEQIRRNPKVEVNVMTPDGAHVRIAGRAHLRDDPVLRQRILDGFPLMQRYFQRADDPDYTLIEVEPVRVGVKDAWDLDYAEIPVEVAR